MRKLSAIVVTTFLVCGCSAVKDGFLVKEWSKNMRELNIYPVFPPREDLYVGDVYVSTAEPTDSIATGAQGFPPLGLLLAHIEVSDALNAYYSKRPEFPASSASAPSASIFNAPKQQRRLKTVAFPFFLKATATGAEIGAMIPFEAIQAKAGVGLNSVKSASVKVSASESYAVPWADMAGNLMDKEGLFSVPVSSRAPSSAETRRLLKTVAMAADGKPATYVDVTVLTEVFYARAFDITLHMNNDAALSAAGSLPSASEISAAASAASGKASTAASLAAAIPASGAASAAEAAVNAATIAAAESEKLQGLLDKANKLAPPTPGLSVGVSASSTGDVGLRQTYERPIAIGYRGVRFRVSLVDGSSPPAVIRNTPFEGSSEGLGGGPSTPVAPARAASSSNPR